MVDLDFWIGFFRILSRIGLGGYFCLQGINGFWNFLNIPPTQASMTAFLDQFAKVPTFLPAIKLSQIILGFCLIFGFFLGLSLVLLGVQIFGIVQLQWVLNNNRSLSMGLGLIYTITCLFHLPELLSLLD